ncbi:glycosyltransferase family 1 protein [Cyanosarcina cf. burmensis CCALA 770]|nr:glycosyltransferase family 1 protein [Cyanosarcina cf. burmensis CCALA 770]
MMKVCFIAACPGTDMRGGPRSLLETIDSLQKLGVECFVLLPAQGRLFDELSRRDIPVRVIPYERWLEATNYPLRDRWRKLKRSYHIAFQIAAQIKEWQCNVVYTNTIAIGVGAFAAFLLRKPHVWHIREFVYEDHGQVFDLGRNLTLKLVDLLSQVCIVNSKAVAQKYEQWIAPTKLKVVYQAVNVTPGEAIALPPTTNFRCIIVGALVEGKRQEDAIRAIAQLVHTGVRVELLIVGDGDPQYREYLENIATKNHIEQFIKFYGYADNPFPLMQSADVVLVCSKCEAFGRVTVEGMRAGKPIIGTRSGGTQELIRDGFNGLLYTAEDERELAQKIRYICDRPDLAKQMGENGQQWAAEQFTPARYGKEIYLLLKQLCGKNLEI